METKYVQGIIKKAIKAKTKDHLWNIQLQRTDRSTFWIVFKGNPIAKADGTTELTGFIPSSTKEGDQIRHYAKERKEKAKTGETVYDACSAPVKEGTEHRDPEVGEAKVYNPALDDRWQAFHIVSKATEIIAGQMPELLEMQSAQRMKAVMPLAIDLATMGNMLFDKTQDIINQYMPTGEEEK